MLVLGIIKLYKTYAIYQEKLMLNIIQGKVSSFSRGDLQLAVYVNDEKVKKIPTKSSEYNVEVDCDTAKSGVIGTWDFTNWGVVINDLGDKQTPVICYVKFNKAYNIMVEGTKSDTFPAQLASSTGYRYDATTNCTNGTGSWDATNWRMNITDGNLQIKCDVNFVKEKIWCTVYRVEYKPVGFWKGNKLYTGGGIDWGEGCRHGTCGGAVFNINESSTLCWVSGREEGESDVFFSANCDDAIRNCNNTLYK